MASSSLWQRFQRYLLCYRDLDFSLDISRMKFSEDFFEKMQPKIEKAFTAMRELEAGAIANPTENRMVGHYWLRNPLLAPTPELRAEIQDTIKRIKRFAEDVHAGKIAAENGERFKHVLLIGIGGSALGPQFVADALGSASAPMDIFFFDNTDADGFDRVFDRMNDLLPQTLVVVVSKSGGTKETRNGMLEAEARFKEKGLQFNKHAVAVTGVGSDLDQYAEKNRWLARFPMYDWIGGRTSVMSAVGLLPMALEGFDIDEFRAGEEFVGIKTFECHREKSDRAHHRGASADPIVHRETREPLVFFGIFVQFAPDASHGYSVFAEMKPLLSEFCFRLDHSISRFLCPARFRHDNDKGLRKAVDLIENAIKPIRIGVIEKIDVHWVVRRSERVGHEFWPKRRAANPG